MASDSVDEEIPRARAPHYKVEAIGDSDELERRCNELYFDGEKPYYLYLLTEDKGSYTAVFAEARERGRR